MKRTVERLRRRLRGRHGMSLGETMVAMVILSLLSLCLATGISFGVREYNRSMVRSESYVLASTLTSVIREELGGTTKVRQEENGFSYNSPYFSQDYGDALSRLVSNDDGHLVVRNSVRDIPLLSDAAYSSKMNLKATLDQQAYDEDANRFTVTLVITDAGNNPQVTRTFDVIPLNTVDVVT